MSDNQLGNSLGINTAKINKIAPNSENGVLHIWRFRAFESIPPNAG